MARIIKAMSAAQVAQITRPGMHAVGGCPGLMLQVAGGGRSWILRAKVGSKRRDIGLGGCAEVSLADAREQCRQMRAQIRAGIDPVAERAAARAALLDAQAKEISFAEAARRAHKARAAEFRNVKHRADWISSLERHAFESIGNLPVSIITVAHVLQVLEPIWITKTETATRLRQRIEAVMSWATVSGFREGDNPARWADNLKELLPLPAKVRKRRHYPALPWQEVPGFMVELRKRDGVSARALEFAILTAGRSGEVRNATWNEVDLAAGIWTIPAERMKAGRKHEVPLSPAAVAVLEALPRTGDHLFTAPRGGPLSDMSISAVCRRMEVEAVPHGFRSSFKDWARNETRFADEVSELALAHVNNDATRAAYARDGLLPQRAQLLNQWADYCAKPRPAVATVTPIKNARKASGESR